MRDPRTQLDPTGSGNWVISTGSYDCQPTIGFESHTHTYKYVYQMYTKWKPKNIKKILYMTILVVTIVIIITNTIPLIPASWFQTCIFSLLG